MKKLIINIVVIFSMLFCIGLTPAFSIEQNKQNIIRITAKSSESFDPDTAVVILAVQTEDKNVPNALQENNKKMNKVLSSLKELIRDEKDSIKTSSFSIRPIKTWDKKLKRSTITGNKVHNSITVKTKQIDKIGKIIDVSIENGANNVNNINFIVDNNDKLYQEVLAKASRKAKEDAKAIAIALGVRIKGIKSVNVNQGHYRPMQYDSVALGKSRESATPIVPGNVDINANVTVEFIIE